MNPFLKIPVSVIIATKNEEKNLARCLQSLHDFDEVVVVDSNSTDGTKTIAESFGVHVVNFDWDGRYPKKRQWILDAVPTRHGMIFFVDADEVMTPELAHALRGEIERGPKDGYFISARCVVQGRILRWGLRTKKLVLFQRALLSYPVLDDLCCVGMGEIEGHYQPVPSSLSIRIGKITAPMIHYVAEDIAAWNERHRRYAAWHAHVLQRQKEVLSQEPTTARYIVKRIFYAMPFRPALAFLQSYILKAGFLDGGAGFIWAMMRGRYYRMIQVADHDIPRA